MRSSMTPTEKKLWRLFFVLAAILLMPFTMAFGLGAALFITINLKLLRLIGAALNKFDLLK